MRFRTIIAGCLGLAACLGLARAGTVDGATSYDLLFRQGALDGLGDSEALVYQRRVVNRLQPEAEARDAGEIALRIEEGEAAPLARLVFRQEDRQRGLGVFPASVGNPMIMFFYESVVRDMAAAAGGSPFYIRNRVKNALVSDAEMETGTAVVDGRSVETTTIRLRPFAEDPNRDRMMGFGDLVLSVAMSEAAPGWYVSLTAEAPGSDGPVYRLSVRLDDMEAAE